jgi:hypothetical protein
LANKSFADARYPDFLTGRRSRGNVEEMAGKTIGPCTTLIGFPLNFRAPSGGEDGRQRDNREQRQCRMD